METFLGIFKHYENNERYAFLLYLDLLFSTLQLNVPLENVSPERHEEKAFVMGQYKRSLPITLMVIPTLTL